MKEKPKILLIEDDPDLGSLLAEYLKLNQFDVDLAENGEKAMEFFRSGSYNLVTIDIMLPDTSGYELARKIKTEKKELPFIFITARNRKEELIAGLKAGAEDYITKPFDPEELVLRLNIALRRNPEPDGGDLSIGHFRLIHNQMALQSPDSLFKLTLKEFQVLTYLVHNKNKLIKRELILEKFWGENDYFKGRSMDVFVSRFRKYLAADDSVKLETIRGAGIILKEEKITDQSSNSSD